MSVTKETVERANSETVGRMMDSEPTWVDVAQAKEKISGLKKTLLHSGPPLEWKDASGPMRGAIIGAVIYEGWASDEKGAAKLVEEG